MPASAGRVRMPHNNRMSTSASLKTHAIWQNAIGHDPYAAPSEANQEENARGNDLEGKKKLEEVMGMARSQNVTDSANRSGFTALMYRGLKKGKQRRGDGEKPQPLDPGFQNALEDLSSSSEEEFVEVEVKRERKKKKSSRKKESRRRRNFPEDSDSSSDESSGRHRKKERKRKERRRSRNRKARRRSNSSDGSSNESVDRRRPRKKR